MKKITEDLLRQISEWDGEFKGAYNIREDGACAGRMSSDNIKIESKKDQPGLEIHILPHTIGETVSIPACVTHGDVDDLVYNDFYVGEYADVTIVAGCGIHTETGEPARHNGIHRFFLKKGSKVKYVEKHIGTGHGTGLRSIDPVTEAELDENAVLENNLAESSIEYSLLDVINRARYDLKSELGSILGQVYAGMMNETSDLIIIYSDETVFSSSDGIIPPTELTTQVGNNIKNYILTFISTWK